jgi:hypothetical protein
MFYRNVFEEYRSHLQTFFPEGVEPVPWTFDPKVVFERKMKYVERLKIIEVRVCCIDTSIQFNSVLFNLFKKSKFYDNPPDIEQVKN